MKLGKLNYMGKTGCKFLADTGIICNKAPMIAAFLKDTIRSTCCVSTGSDTITRIM
jgi:hypothetical protein